MVSELGITPSGRPIDADHIHDQLYDILEVVENRIKDLELLVDELYKAQAKSIVEAITGEEMLK